MKLLFPLINVVLALALFFGITDQLVNAPLVEASDPAEISASTGGIKALLERQEELSLAVETATALRERIAELRKTYTSFTAEDQARLDLLLPDNIDNIQLIIDINRIAQGHNMTIKNIRVEDGRQPAKAPLASAPTNNRVGVASLSFSITGPYEAYKRFLADLSHSLRIIDITSSSFSSDEKGLNTYAIELRTYWLKK